MTDMTDTVAPETQAADAPEAGAETGAENRDTSNWVKRFGTLTGLVARETRKGDTYLVATLDCRAFTQTVYIFDKTAQEKTRAARKAHGEATRMWFYGPVDVRTVDGIDRQSYKAVIAKDITEQTPKADGAADAEVAGDQVAKESVDEEENPF